MTLRDIAVAFGYEVDNASVKKAEGSIKGISNMAKKLLGAITVYFSVQGLSSLAQAAADAKALESQFTQVFGDMEQEATDSLKAVADEAGAMTNRMKGSFTQLAAFSKTTGANASEALEIASRGMKAASDSAAFYDRSLEDMTASLQSFMKGNYANDAALGLSCTETTRNAAANELYGQSFKNLSEYQKQLTLLKMVEDANKTSGALGQAARESDTWTNQLGNLKQSLTDLKAAAGSTFLKPAIAVLKVFTLLTQKATRAVKSLTAENGLLTKATDRYHALVKRLQPAVTRMTQAMTKGWSKARDVMSTVVTRLGGIDNTVKILTVSVGAMIAALKWSTIINGLSKVKGLFSGIGKLFSFSTLKIFGIAAAIMALYLIAEDFIYFLSGNNSLIGTFFDRAGIGSENARKAIFNAWKKIKAFLSDIWNWIKNTASHVFTVVKDVITKHMGSILDSVSKIWNGIKTILSVIWNNISGLAKIVFGGLLSFFSDWNISLEGIFDALVSAVDGVLAVFGKVGDWISEHKGLMDVFVTVLGSLAAAFVIVKGAIAAYNIVAGICTTVSAIMASGFSVASAAGGVLAGVMAFITSPITIAVAAIGAIIAACVLLCKNWETVKGFAISIWNGIVGIFQGAWEGIKAIFSGVGEFFQGVWDAIVSVFTAVGTAISDAVTGAVKGAINGILSGAIGIINGFISAINLAIGIINKIPGVELKKLKKLEVPQLAEGGIATAATSAIIGEGAEPEAVMPLSKLGGMISKYIREAKESEAYSTVSSMIKQVVSALSVGVNAFTKAATPSTATASNSTTNNTTSNVVQNVEINNTYNGGERETQKNVSKAMKKSAVDATTQMARSLAYARG